ncbi:Glycosyl transferase [marine actinobacterium PHSC20C1]|nr:Glycosyl transferase [marine actinobacterium PHSC20C1]
MDAMHTESSCEAAAPGLDYSTWIVIPLYNEASVIAGVVSELLGQFANVVCVDDGSTDGSAQAALDAGARVLTHPLNLGQGAALQTAISYAVAQPGCEHIITFDADGQHRIIDALHMLERAREEKLDIVFGSRFLDDRTNPGILKRIVLKTAVGVTNLTTGLKLTDAHNGLRVLSAEAASRINLQQDRMAHATEIVLQLGRTRLPWGESPVEVLYTDYSKAKGQSLLNSINILFDLVVN